MNTFIPDLIIEVTGACNRACFGCYAPNIVSNEAATILYEKQPEIFLGILALNNALNELERLPSITSIRGGEPSLHPKLPILLRMVSSHTDHVVMETHGRWLLPENVSAYQDLIQSVSDSVSRSHVWSFNGDIGYIGNSVRYDAFSVRCVASSRD